MLTAASRVPGTLHPRRTVRGNTGRIAAAREHRLPRVPNGHQRKEEDGRPPAENADVARRQEAARAYFTPELARIVALHVHILDRLVVNFGEASMKRATPGDSLASFRPRSPVLYPAAPQFGDLSEADATRLVEFYDASHDVAETVDGWIENKTPIDVNAYNLLMQSVQHSLTLGQTAVHSFCPDRQYSPLMPASGTLTHRIQTSVSQAEAALAAHLRRAATA